VATRTQYLTYYIVLTDPDAVAAYQAQYPHGVNRAPYNAAINGGAAIEFAAPWRGYLASALGQAPYTWTPWSGAGSNAGPYPINVATFTRHTGGFWGIGGTTTKYLWIGEFVYAPSTAEPPGGTGDTPLAPDLEYAPISLRRWMTGFEIPCAGPAGLTSVQSAYNFCADAARHVGGMGLALRGPNNNVSTIAPSIYRAITPANGWCRTYVRLRKVPAGSSINFWSTVGFPTAANGVALDVNAAGQLTVYTAGSGGRSILGTIDPALPAWNGLSTDDAWRRLDLLYEYANGGANGYFRLFVDGAMATSFTIASGSGLGTGTSIQAIKIGDAYSGGANTLELDLDDTFDADLPPGQDSLGTNGAGRPYIYDSAGLYLTGDLVHTKDGHAYKCIKNIASAVPLDGSVVPTPTSGGTFWHRYEGRDWLNGTRILLSKPKAFGAAHSVNWTGDVRVLMQNHYPGTSTIVAGLTSSTASAIAEAEMDVAEMIDPEANAVGVVSVLPTVNSTRGANSGQLGYNINAAGNVNTAITEGAAGAGTWNSVLYPGPALTTLIDVSPLQVRLTKGTSADAAAVRSLLAEVELAGVFDRHDYRPTPEGGAWDGTTAYILGDVVERKHVWYQAIDAAAAGADPSTAAGTAKWSAIALPEYPRFVGQHNWPYRRSVYVNGALAAPVAPVIFVGGTYTGNATGQDLPSFRAPVGLLFIRPLTGGAGGYVWWPTMETGHPAFQQGVAPLVVDAVEDLTFTPAAGEDTQSQRYLIRIAGSHSQVNANAVVYQYIAVLDPGARFMLNAAAQHNSALAPDVDNNLIDPTFLAEWVFAWVESFDATATVRFYAKGPGNAAQTISNFGSSAVASALILASGKLTSRTAFNALGSAGNFAFNCWRRADGNADPGQAAVVNIGTYIGDGSASRTINLSPASSKRPLFALVFSEAATGFWRDPSHTASNSTNSAGADTATGITGGGVDSLSVGSALNTNAVIYNYIVFFAGTGAGNNGWGTNGEYIPVEAGPPATGPWPTDPDPTEFATGDGGDGGEPTPAPVGEPDLATACVAETQRLGNIALSRIGVSKVITDLVAENTMEAAILRLHVKTDVEAVLADFPWPFATRYASLVLVAGSEAAPANVDWVYSYRAPTDLVVARRLGGQMHERRAWDPNPLTFRLGSDTTGGLIYSNAAIATGVPLVLEYTARVTCPASTGSPLFKDALAWRFAASLAMPLARDEKQQAYCLGMYERVLRQAEAVAANEMQQDKRGDADWIQGRN
jgi:hypothetical protein